MIRRDAKAVRRHCRCIRRRRASLAHNHGRAEQQSRLAVAPYARAEEIDIAVVAAGSDRRPRWQSENLRRLVRQSAREAQRRFRRRYRNGLRQPARHMIMPRRRVHRWRTGQPGHEIAGRIDGDARALHSLRLGSLPLCEARQHVIGAEFVLGESVARQHRLPLGLGAVVGGEDRRIPDGLEVLVQQDRARTERADADGLNGRHLDVAERLANCVHDTCPPIFRRDTMGLALRKSRAPARDKPAPAIDDSRAGSRNADIDAEDECHRDLWRVSPFACIAGAEQRDNCASSRRTRNSPRQSPDRSGRGSSQLARATATAAPVTCARMKPGASAGRIPEKVSDSVRARVAAGLAKEVEAVNQ